jgi:ribosomal protein L37AE/L43A
MAIAFTYQLNFIIRCPHCGSPYHVRQLNPEWLWCTYCGEKWCDHTHMGKKAATFLLMPK